LKASALGDKIMAISTLAIEAGRTVCGESLISASVGLASWPDDGATADELIGEADRRMYSDKNNRKQKPPPRGRAALEQSVAVH